MAGDQKQRQNKKSTRAKKPPKTVLALDRSFGPNLRRCRKAAGYSQEALAERAEVHRTEISLVERGLRNAGVDVVTRLIGALEVEPNALFEGITWMPPGGGRDGRFSYAKKKS
jgi:ribosome-binding protein aMBF1 (putative translation factor)